MSAEKTLRNAVDNDVDRYEAGAESYKDRILSELKSLVNDAERLFRRSADSSSDGLSSVRSEMDRKLERARDRLERTRKLVNRSAQRSTEAAREYVQENPFRAVAVATAAGVLIGLLVVSFLNNRR